MRKWFALLFFVSSVVVAGCSKDPGEEVNPPDPGKDEMMEMENIGTSEEIPTP